MLPRIGKSRGGASVHLRPLRVLGKRCISRATRRCGGTGGGWSCCFGGDDDGVACTTRRLAARTARGARLRRLNMDDAVLLPTGASVFEIYDLERGFRVAAMELRRVVWG